MMQKPAGVLLPADFCLSELRICLKITEQLFALKRLRENSLLNDEVQLCFRIGVAAGFVRASFV